MAQYPAIWLIFRNWMSDSPKRHDSCIVHIHDVQDILLAARRSTHWFAPGRRLAIALEGMNMAWVLIVDDDAAIRDTLEIVLHDAGYAIVEVGDGRDALDVLRATPYHAVVLLDLLMPGMSGTTVLDRLLADPALARRHAWIAMSADDRAIASITPQQQSRLSLTVIRKPFEMDDLLATIDRQSTLLSNLPE